MNGELERLAGNIRAIADDARENVLRNLPGLQIPVHIGVQIELASFDQMQHRQGEYWLADGFHRLAAVKKEGTGFIPVEIHPGTRRDAVLYSVGANATHGLPRTNADKRRAVLILLQDEEWAAWSDGMIAKAAAA